MPLSPDQVSRIAALARIELEPAEKERARVELESILGLVEQLRAADVAGVEPMAHPASSAAAARLRLREDRVTETDRRSLYQSVAPQVSQGLYVVPKVIE
jgi:aspartyl-tRNA(Asn)/glutamyl-tRNA(Gln) amidotransferase subunit C